MMFENSFNNYNIGVFYDLISIIINFPNLLGIDRVYKFYNKKKSYISWVNLFINISRF